MGGFSVQSDFARSNARLVAVAASLGLISTRIKGNTFGTVWFITKQGLEIVDECF